MPITRLLLLTNLLLTVVAVVVVSSQPMRREIVPFPVTMGSELVQLPFAGGINTPNHDFVDIDGDGDLDLFLFDNDLYQDFYRNEGTRFAPSFMLEPNAFAIPKFLSWFRLIDYNGDGRFDLATDDSLAGMKFYRNDGTAEYPIFSLENSPVVDDSGDPVFSGYFSIPAFVDINGDSLFDFLSSNSADGSLNYYQNVGTRQSPLYHFVTGNFSNITVIGDSCYATSVRQRTTSNAHGAGGLSFADIDANGTPDLFYGDFFASGLFFMNNIGTPQSPLLECTSNRYPPGGSLATTGFNHANLEDIDGDSDRDLFVGVLNNMQKNGFWFYENSGSAASPLFTFRTKNYLSVLDVGLNAHPAVVDIDGDGDLDLIVGNACDNACISGQLSYFRNTGSPSSPAFTLVDSLFGGITGNYSYAPALADLDDDADPDLVLGRGDGRVIIYRNNAGVFIPVDTIVSNQSAVPALADLDGDGDPDLLVGKFNGQISYYRNDGSPSSFNYVLVTPSFEGIAVGQNAKPAFAFDLQQRVSDLYIGNAAGKILYYKNMGDSLSPTFVLHPSPENIDSLRESALAMGDMDNDGDNDLFVGTSKGGMHFYRNDLFTRVEDAESLPSGFSLAQNYPNPFNPTTNISFSLAQPGHVRLSVFNLFGQEVIRLLDARVAAGSYAIPWNAFSAAGGVASGVYYYRLQSKESSLVRKMLLVK